MFKHETFKHETPWAAMAWALCHGRGTVTLATLVIPGTLQLMIEDVIVGVCWNLCLLLSPTILLEILYLACLHHSWLWLQYSNYYSANLL